MTQTTEKMVLELAKTELVWTDEAIDKLLANESLPEPIDCKPGCHYCCFNLPMVTPLEALLIGHHLDQTLTDAQKHALREKIRKIQQKIYGKPFDDVLMMRHELPCIFLTESMCMIYGVRPAVCRTCTSTSAEHCQLIFESRNHRARLRCYPQIREIFHIVHSRLIDRCREMGCQSDALHIHGATEDYFRHPEPIDAWLSGESIFQINV
ncbi:MAG: YkgJ family cysteine cluster protein [Deltaproteobacteria bacterium]|nr:YkgJ family cysteine cluster protein [Deltaproteobacteria bacterium]